MRPPPRFGAHMSIAGGLPRAVDRAVLHGCDALQIFTKSAGQWRARPIPDEEARAFTARVRETGIAPVVAHASYLINAGASVEPLRSRSIESLAEELARADRLGLAGLVLHPGAATGRGVDEALECVARALRQVLKGRRRRACRILLEHTAGQGTSLGWRFEHLRQILEALDGDERVGVCLDTCHLIAAGYAIDSADGVDRTLAEFDRVVGLARLHVVHVNDSKRPLGSRVDRHTHIGEGTIGLEGFRAIVNHPALAGLPMLLETPKTEQRGTGVALDPLDARNLATLRGLWGNGKP